MEGVKGCEKVLGEGFCRDGELPTEPLFRGMPGRMVLASRSLHSKGLLKQQSREQKVERTAV